LIIYSINQVIWVRILGIKGQLLVIYSINQAIWVRILGIKGQLLVIYSINQVIWVRILGIIGSIMVILTVNRLILAHFDCKSMYFTVHGNQLVYGEIGDSPIPATCPTAAVYLISNILLLSMLAIMSLTK